jgi:acyl-CoA synthetase (NDP forming)
MKPDLEYLFHPRSVAITGVSNVMTKFGGRIFLDAIIDAGFKGRIYPISPNGGKISGLEIYPSIKDVPDRIDYVISAIPAKLTPQLVTDCAAKGVRAIHIFSSGLSELGNEEGRALESQIANIAKQNNIRIIGPNCMGIYCPKAGLSFTVNFPRESGSVGYIAQSGGHSLYGVREAAMRGIRFSKAISYGNACDLNESDFLEYLTQDPETRVIAIYIEGVKDGHHFFQALKEATKVKPVIVYKAGNTEAGASAAASHTNAMVGSKIIWESLLKQTGAIQVYSIEEIIDVALLFNHLSSPSGKKVAIIGVGGGAGVQAADACSNAGLTVPPLSTEVRQKLKDIFRTEAGMSFKNPIDLSPSRHEQIQEAIKLVTNLEQVDLSIIHMSLDFQPISDNRPLVNETTNSIIRLEPGTNKHVVVILQQVTLPESKQLASEAQIALSKAGFPVFPSASRAANAISKFIQYHQQR